MHETGIFYGILIPWPFLCYGLHGFVFFLLWSIATVRLTTRSFPSGWIVTGSEVERFDKHP